MKLIFWFNTTHFYRTRNVDTPEIVGNLLATLPTLLNVSRTTSRSRTTMMPSDIAQLQSKTFIRLFS